MAWHVGIVVSPGEETGLNKYLETRITVLTFDPNSVGVPIIIETIEVIPIGTKCQYCDESATNKVARELADLVPVCVSHYWRWENWVHGSRLKPFDG